MKITKNNKETFVQYLKRIEEESGNAVSYEFVNEKVEDVQIIGLWVDWDWKQKKDEAFEKAEQKLADSFFYGPIPGCNTRKGRMFLGQADGNPVTPVVIMKNLILSLKSNFPSIPISFTKEEVSIIVGDKPVRDNGLSQIKIQMPQEF